MRKIKLPTVAVILLAIFISMAPVTGASESFAETYPAPSNNTFQFSHYPQENITFTLENSTLTVENLPDTAAFRSIFIRIVNSIGSAQIEDLFTRKTDGSASISLRNLSSGNYYIELYSHAGGDIYTSYVLGKDVLFRWQNGAGVFVEPPSLARNRLAFEAGRKDNAALAYYLNPSYLIQSADPAIVKLAFEITNGLVYDYEKTLAIHDWICSNLWYDYDSLEYGKRLPADALSTLNNRRAVCEGYANLTAALLRAVSIPAKTVGGYAKENHLWNEVYVNGRWMIIDTTWNCGNKYRGGRYTENLGIYSYRYFNATIEAFSVDHRIDLYEDFIIPLPDNPSPWAIQQVNAAISAGIVPQILRVKYTQATTRAEFCALAVALYETTTGKVILDRRSFLDTSDINVEKAAAIGAVNGVGNNRFAPDDPLTREQAAVMLSRLSDAIKKPLAKQAATFSDNDNISSWAIENAGQIQAAGIMSGIGNNTFAPKSPYTREQSIITIMRLYDRFTQVSFSSQFPALKSA